MRKRILIVDDDPDFREAVASFLELKGFEVVEAEDGRSALTLARRERPDLVLMDVMMDERTEGFFAVQEMRRIPELSGVPIIVVSSIYGEIPDFSISPQQTWLGHDEFLPKPLDLNDLLETVHRVLEGGGDNKTRLAGGET